MSYSWFVFGRETSFLESSSPGFPSLQVKPWPGTEDLGDWEDLTSQVRFDPRYWAEITLVHGGVPREVWSAHELMVRRVADAMHGVALTEDAAVLHVAERSRPISQRAFEGWLSDLMGSARRAAKLRRAMKPAAMTA